MDMDELRCSPVSVNNDVMVCGSEGVWIRVVVGIMPGTVGEAIVLRTPEVSSFPGWVTLGDVVPGWSGEIARVEVMKWFSVLELVANDGIVSAIVGEIGHVAISELCCSSICVTNDTVVFSSAEIRFGDVIISGMLCEMFKDRTPEVPSFPGWVSHGAVVPG